MIRSRRRNRVERKIKGHARSESAGLKEPCERET